VGGGGEQTRAPLIWHTFRTAKGYVWGTADQVKSGWSIKPEEGGGRVSIANFFEK